MTANERAREMMREGREAVGLTQTEAADRMGVTQVEWSRWETGARGLTLERIDKIAEALGLELSMSLSKPAPKKRKAPSKRRRS